jgi:hypothetical protein
MRSCFLLFSVLGALWSVLAAQDTQLLFREDWKESEPSLPVDQNHVAHADLRLSLHGPGMYGVKKSHHDWIENDPFYVWSGPCPGSWAVSLKHVSRRMDLSGKSRIRWRTKQSGFRQLRLVLKLASGAWLVSDAYDDASEDWRVFEIAIPDLRWRELDIKRVTEANWVESPDLTQVEEVGFTDLMPGGASAACSRLDWIEVYGRWGTPR